MKKLTAIILAVLMLITCVPHVLAQEAQTKGAGDGSLIMTNKNYNLALNETAQIFLKWPSPEGKIIWETSDSDIVEVDSYGKLHATGYGIATVTATAEETGDYDCATVRVNSETVWYEDFDSNLDNWGVFDGDDDGRSWIMASDYDEPVQTIGYDAALCASYYPNSGDRLNSDDYLVSQKFDIPSDAKSASLHFIAGALGSYTETMYVYVSVGANSIHDVLDSEYYLFQFNTDYNVYTLNLSDCIGMKNVQIAFNYYGNDCYAIWLDNVGIYLDYEKINDISVTSPLDIKVGDKAGDHMQYNNLTDHCNVCDVSWWNETDWCNMASDDVFEANKEYSLGWTLQADYGYRFDSAAKVLINNESDCDEEYTEISYNGKFFYVWTAYITPTGDEELTPIPKVELNDVTIELEPGKKAGDLRHVTVPSSIPVEIKDLYWFDDTDGKFMSDTDVFVEGHVYSFNIQGTPKTGYMFTDDTEFYINGSMEHIDTNESYHYAGSFSLWTLPTLCGGDNLEAIEKVEINDVTLVPEPGKKAGDLKKATVPSNIPVEITYLGWYDDTEDEYMDDTDVFEVGHLYSFNIDGASKSGYMFTAGTEFYIDGSQDNVDLEYLSVETLYFTIWTVPTLCGGDTFEEIEKVEINDVTLIPEPGKKAGDLKKATVPSSIPVEIKALYWFDVTDSMFMSDSDVFVEGHVYSLKIEGIAKTGYKFTDSTEFYINGSKDNVYSSYADPLNFYIWTAPAVCGGDILKSIDKVEITGVKTTPIIGEKTEDFMGYSIPDDAHYTVAKVQWYGYDPVTGKTYPFDGTFEAEKYYQVVFSLKPESGYAFASDAEMTINGKAVDPNSYHGIFECVIGSIPEKSTDVIPSDVLTGDANRDGKVNTSDAVFILKFAADMITFDEEQMVIADCNFDGKVNTADAVAVLKYAAGMIPGFEKSK